jgi:hypothetical protein
MLSARVARAVRAGVSLATLARLVPPPPPRPEGVTALVRISGDEEWIEPCLTSLDGFANEILVLDNGATAETRTQVDRIGRSSAAAIRRIDCTAVDLPAVATRGLAESRFRWAFLWDADLVARTEGPNAIANLKRFLAGLDPRRYYLVYVRTLELAGDLQHRFPDVRERYDPHVLTVGPRARYVWRERRTASARQHLAYRALGDPAPARLRLRYDTLEVPKYYRVLYWREPAVFHVNVKSGRRTLLRRFWLEWLGSDGREGLEAFARRRVRERWGEDDLATAVARFMAEYCAPLERVDDATLGGYPRALLPHVERAVYRVLYEDGRIIGRSEAEHTAGVRAC